jgi:predicted AAA+ superfamily ATPase
MADIKSILKEQRQELETIERNEHIILRDGMDEAKKYLKFPNILVITGIRRCGKSIFSYLLEKGHSFSYVNFDDERLVLLKSSELDDVLKAIYELYGDVDYLIFDEIQNITGWELFINRLRRTKRVIITGSNSNLLSKELATHLTGRYLDVCLFPFSFREFLNFRKFTLQNAYTTLEKAKISTLLSEYMINGGFPEVYKFGKPILERIYENILVKDIILRYKIKKVDEFKRFSRYLISNTSSEIGYSKIARILGINRVSTISNWLSYLESSFIFFKLERFDFKLKKQYIAPKKIYCIDSGLVDSIGFKFSENKGAMIENIIAIELQRRKMGKEIYYWKDYLQNEVDFVVKQDKKIIQLIQSHMISSKEEIKDREISGILKASEELSCNNLLIITSDFAADIEYSGKIINFIPVWKWLLSD